MSVEVILLKDCPFCGAEVFTVRTETTFSETGFAFSIECPVCHTRQRARSTEEEVAEIWNRRRACEALPENRA